MTDASFWVAIAIGAGIVMTALTGSAIIVAVVLRHRDKIDLQAEARRIEVASDRHAKIMDEVRHLQGLTLRAIGGREALEAAVAELKQRLLAQKGRLEEHSGSISDLRKRLGLDDSSGNK